MPHPDTPAPARPGPRLDRRQWLRAAAAATMAGALAPTPRNARAARLTTQAHIVIVGSGLGGIAVAHRLAALLDGARITIIDRKEEHNYQPGYTLVATGVWPVHKVSDRNADLHPEGITWIKAMVDEFDPAASTVVTSDGRRVRYDFLVVATGVHLDFAQIEGMDVTAIGTPRAPGLASVYPGPLAAQATWHAMQSYVERGGGRPDDAAGDPDEVRWRPAEDDLHAA